LFPLFACRFLTHVAWRGGTRQKNHAKPCQTVPLIQADGVAAWATLAPGERVWLGV